MKKGVALETLIYILLFTLIGALAFFAVKALISYLTK